MAADGDVEDLAADGELEEADLEEQAADGHLVVLGKLKKKMHRNASNPCNEAIDLDGIFWLYDEKYCSH